MHRNDTLLLLLLNDLFWGANRRHTLTPTPQNTNTRPPTQPQAVVDAINDAQARAAGGPAGAVDFGGGAGSLRLERTLPLAGACLTAS